MSTMIPEAYRLGVEQIVGYPEGIDGPLSLERTECAFMGPCRPAWRNEPL